MQHEPTQPPLLSSLNFTVLCAILFLISFLGLFIPIMEVDAAQYASMSLEMLENKAFLQVTDLGIPYLDKPPLLFWLSSASIALLGNTSFAFKLPSFILAWWSVFFLYRLVKIYYTNTIAKLSALLYAGSVAFILFTNDVRTDTLMISFTVFAVWQIALFIENSKFKHLCLGAIGIGFAMLAKGPIGAAIPIMAIAPHLLLKGKILQVFKWQVLLVPLIVLCILSPMLLGLYEQWGEHGIRFYFWEQSFGRITGENVWKNEATYFYFLHNIAWAFLPFTLFLVIGLLRQFKSFKYQSEYISLFGFLLPFLALSLSQYKLPHYIYVVIPFAAVIAAKEINYWLNHRRKFLDRFIGLIQFIIIVALTILPFALFIAFPGNIFLYLLYFVAFNFILFTFYFLKEVKSSIFYTTLFAFFTSVFFLNLHAYPKLLHYQGSSEAGMYIVKHNMDIAKLYQLNIWWRAFHYYSGNIVPTFNEESFRKTPEVYVYTDEKGLAYLEANFETKIVKSFPHFNVTRLSLPFLNPNTRKEKLSYQHLLKVKKHHEENL